MENIDDIKNIPLKLKSGNVTTISQFATIENEISEPQGYHIYNGNEGLVITVQKQANARMNALLPKIDTAISLFKKDYPQIKFATTQNQAFLLDQGIQNLTQDLWFGGIFCVILLFLFLGNYASPIIMSISIPISLLLTFIFFYFFNISFNIISLSGLALGIGMLIDNSIVVLDSITRKRREGLFMDESCIIGVRDVMSPVISNVLTTVAIYAPLIYMSGLAGALVYDQAIALTISLVVSLVVAFCLNPVLYKYFLKTDPVKLKEDTRFYIAISKKYHQMILHIFKCKKFYFIITLLLMPLGFVLFKFVPVTTLPVITETETLITIDWNSPIDAAENLDRIKTLGSILKDKVEVWEADAGITQFLLQSDINSIQKAKLYYKCASEKQKLLTDKTIDGWFKDYYPDANWEIKSAPNAFTQLFENKQSYLEARFKPFNNSVDGNLSAKFERILSQMKTKHTKGLSFLEEVNVEMKLDYNKMALYGISQTEFQKELERIFGSANVSEIKRFGDSKAVKFKSNNKYITEKLNTQIKKF